LFLARLAQSGRHAGDKRDRAKHRPGRPSLHQRKSATANNYLLDGIEINETINNYVLQPESGCFGRSEVIAANAEAEYGNVAGGDVIALVKSGSNQFHAARSRIWRTTGWMPIVGEQG